jgi:two-component system, OmpR family, KDP operon response regulator KdpE
VKILLVDDDTVFLFQLARYLERQGHQVACTAEGREALAMTSRLHPEVVVLDVLLPDIDGIEICCGLRTFSDVPVLILSGVGSEQVIIDALEAGADDYMTKPFHLRDLEVRLQALVRRIRGASRTGMVYDDGYLHIDIENRVATRAGKPISLTSREWAVLTCLVCYAGRPVSFEQLVREVLGASVELDRGKAHLAVLIHSLRAALEEDPSAPMYINTRIRMGYQFVERTAWAEQEHDGPVDGEDIGAI